jgi:YVTN family beta-propeller protein
MDSAVLSERQIKLSEFHLPVGKYERMKWTISEAKVKKGAKTLSLALPQPAGEHLLDIEFIVFRRESLALFVDWNPEESVFDKYLFRPRMVHRRQGIEIEKALVYVTNSGSDCVTVIDRQRDIVVATIAVGQTPMGIVASPDGTKVYVANFGSNSISVIDTAARRMLNTIGNFGYSPAELALSEDGRWLYATNPESDNVTVIDTVSNTVVQQIPVGRRPAGIAFDQDRRKIYVANSASNSISIIDKETYGVEATVTVGLKPGGLAIHEDKLYVANWGSSEVSVIGMPSYSVTKTIPVTQRPSWVQSGLSGRIYVSNADNNEISFLYASMGMVTKDISVGDLPSHMAVDPLRRKLYVVNGLSEDVSVIDLATRRVKTVIEVGRKPHGIAVVAE